MRTGHSYGFAGLCVAAGLALTGCQTLASGTESEGDPPATVEVDPEGGPATLTLIEEAVGRLGIETAAVEQPAEGLTIPYAAVVYDADGGAWAFVELEPRTYQRAPITIVSITGDRTLLSAGPEPGTAVVTVGAAELVGVEAGISGGE